jgi:NitT/TauT family transport system permease protein
MTNSTIATAESAVQSPVRKRGGVVSLAIFVALAAAWEIIVRLFKVPEILVPAPSAIAQALWDGFAIDPSSPLALDIPTLSTMWKALLGLALGSLVGLGIAVLLSRFRVVEKYAMPYVMAFQSLPKIALAPLLIVWCGFGPASTIVLVTTSCFFPILVNSIEGFKTTEQDRIDLLRSMGATPAQIFRGVVFPSALPFIFSGLQIGVVVSLLSTIVGEFVNGRDGLGAQILYANNVLDIAQVFAVLIILGAMAALFDFVLRMIRRRVLFWSPGERRLGL